MWGASLSTCTHSPQRPMGPLPTYNWILRTMVCVHVKPPSYPLIFARNSCNTEEVTCPLSDTTHAHRKITCALSVDSNITHMRESCTDAAPTCTTHTEVSLSKVTLHTHTLTHTRGRMPLTQPNTTPHREVAHGRPRKCRTDTDTPHTGTNTFSVGIQVRFCCSNQRPLELCLPTTVFCVARIPCPGRRQGGVC